jgi:hypothetical protein
MRHTIIIPLSLTYIILGSLNSEAASPYELQQLAAAHFSAGQGISVQAEDGTILVAQQEARPVHPA